MCHFHLDNISFLEEPDPVVPIIVITPPTLSGHDQDVFATIMLPDYAATPAVMDTPIITTALAPAPTATENSAPAAAIDGLPHAFPAGWVVACMAVVALLGTFLVAPPILASRRPYSLYSLTMNPYPLSDDDRSHILSIRTRVETETHASAIERDCFLAMTCIKLISFRGKFLSFAAEPELDDVVSFVLEQLQSDCFRPGGVFFKFADDIASFSKLIGRYKPLAAARRASEAAEALCLLSTPKSQRTPNRLPAFLQRRRSPSLLVPVDVTLDDAPSTSSSVVEQFPSHSSACNSPVYSPKSPSPDRPLSPLDFGSPLPATYQSWPSLADFARTTPPPQHHPIFSPTPAPLSPLPSPDAADLIAPQPTRMDVSSLLNPSRPPSTADVHLSSPGPAISAPSPEETMHPVANSPIAAPGAGTAPTPLFFRPNGHFAMPPPPIPVVPGAGFFPSNEVNLRRQIADIDALMGRVWSDRQRAERQLESCAGMPVGIPFGSQIHLLPYYFPASVPLL
ncbi:hypothetical protein HMN09_01000500 [Mycena chlorophos]|uniref:Uncharacterized protein n=1 Tax=Mycena chlorophos TaxID=658473 RepID=A0A8H6SIE1_MYCCL|nr:hypothetical protein HMN09_01000500 [Mycena chlorophos]